jgi:hypothetical protein
MSTLPPKLPDVSPPAGPLKKSARGFFPPAVIKAAAFYIISLCILAGVVVCILAIWDFAKRDTLWRFASSFLVVAGGAVLFAFVNGMFGTKADA